MMMKKEKKLSKYQTSAVTHDDFYSPRSNGTDAVNVIDDDSKSAIDNNPKLAPPFPHPVTICP